MTVKLASLRVGAEFDASAYQRGAAQKVAADAQMIKSGDSLGASLAAADAKVAKMAPGVARLSVKFLEGYANSAKFEAAIRQVGSAVDRGMGLDRATQVLDAIYARFGKVAVSADLAKAGFQSIIPVIDQINSKIAVQQAIAQRAAMAQSLAMNQAGFQTAINTRLGVRDDFNTAGRAADIAAYGNEIDSLVKRFAPLRAATEAYESDVLELNRALQVGAITADEFGQAQVMLQDRLAERRSAYLPAAPTVAGKQQQLSSQELANVSFQLNDIAVMTASGQAPFVMLAQQGMQLAQVLGPRGLLGAAQALGTGILAFVTNPVNLAVIAIAGVAAGATALFSTLKSNGPAIEDLLKTETDLLKEMRDLWGETAIAAERYHRGASAALRLRGEMQVRDLQAGLGSSTADAISQMDSRYAQGQIGRYANVTALDPLDQAVLQLRRSALTGTPEIGKFRDTVNLLATMPGVSESMKDRALEMIRLTDETAKAEDEIKRLTDAMESMPPDRKMTEALGQRSYNIQRDRDLSQLALGHQIDMDEIGARSPAAKADIAGRREALSLLNEEIDSTVALHRVENARALAYAQAQYEINQGNRDRIFSGEQAIASARLEVDLIGKTAGETALLKANFQAYWDLKRAAEQNGLAFDQQFYELLVKQNQELAIQAQVLAERKLGDDLQFETDQLFRSPREQEIESRLRSSGIDLASPEADAFRKQLEFNAALKDFRELSSEAWSGFISDLRAGVSLMDASLNALNRISDRLFDMASEQLFNQIFAMAQQFLVQSPGGPPGGGMDITMGGLYAEGGNAVPGQVYRINENGEEYFQPHVPGRILPSGTFDNMDNLAAQTAASQWDGARRPINVEMKTKIYNTVGNADVRSQFNPTTQEMEIFVDQRISRGAADPYSTMSKVMGSRGARPRLRER